ncbi:MAG: trypsin-like serine peptidase [Methylobacter sp.]
MKKVNVAAIVFFNFCIELSAAAQDLINKTDTDLRQEISRDNPEYQQLNAIGMISFNGKYQGSGFLVSPCLVLTNIHVAYSKNESLKSGKTVQFSVGQTGSFSQAFKHEKINSQVVEHGTYDRSEQDTNSDWALVKLSQKITDINFIKLYQMPSSASYNHKIITAGFPSNRAAESNYSKMYGDIDCKIIGTSGWGYILHTCQTTGGQSGSPILAKGKDGLYYALGMVGGNRRNEQGVPQSGLEKSEDPNQAHRALSFESGKPYNIIVQGDEIKSAISKYNCD